MAINIVDLLKSQLGGQVAGQLGKQFGESEQSAQSGISALIPTILGGLLKQVSAPGGADKLDKTLTDGGYDGSLLDNISGMLTGGSGAGSPAGKGGDLISMLFGDKVAMLTPIIAKLTGMKASSISSMLAVLAPLVMSFLGKQKKSMGLDANGLASMLKSQKVNIGAALPAGIADAAGLGSLGFTSSTASRTAAPVPAAGGGGLLKLLIPLALVLAAVGYGCYTYIFAGIRAPGAAGNTIVETDPNAPPSEGYGPPTERPAEETMAEPASDAAAGLGLPAMGAMPDLKSMLASMSGALDKIKDEETATAALPELESMQQKLADVSTGFSAMPDMLKGKVSDMMKTMMPDLQATVDKVMAIPGVKEILQPLIDKVMASIKSLSA